MATAVRYNGPHTQVSVTDTDGTRYVCGNGQQITVSDALAASLFAEGWTAPDGSTPGYTPPISHVIEDVFLDNGVLSKQGTGGTSTPVSAESSAQILVMSEAVPVLAAGDTYQGAPIDLTSDGGVVEAIAISDQAGTLHAEDATASTGAFRRIVSSATGAAGSLNSARANLPVVREFVRLVYVNGATAQGSFELNRTAS